MIPISIRYTGPDIVYRVCIGSDSQPCGIFYIYQTLESVFRKLGFSAEFMKVQSIGRILEWCSDSDISSPNMSQGSVPVRNPVGLSLLFT